MENTASMQTKFWFINIWLVNVLVWALAGCTSDVWQDSVLSDDSDRASYPADSRLAQNYVLFAYKNMGLILENCLNPDFDPCLLTAREKHLLSEILKALPKEYQTENQVEFRSEAEDPGFFFLDGNVRIAKTFDAVGDKIYFNQDMLYQPGGGNHPEPVDPGVLIAMLVHELGHHHRADPPYTHAELDRLGSRVRENNARKMHVLQDDGVELLYSPALIAINGDPKKYQTSQLWFVGTSNLSDMTTTFLLNAYCPYNFPQSNDYYDNYAIRFSFHYAGITASEPRVSLSVQSYGDMVCHSRMRSGEPCMNCLRILVPNPARYSLSIKLKPDPNGAGADLDSFSLRVTHQTL